jgi:hypothetical protein
MQVRGTVMTDDAKIAAIGRNLAQALADFSYSRKDDDKKRIAQLQTELCAAVRAESAPQEPTDG